MGRTFVSTHPKGDLGGLAGSYVLVNLPILGASCRRAPACRKEQAYYPCSAATLHTQIGLVHWSRRYRIMRQREHAADPLSGLLDLSCDGRTASWHTNPHEPLPRRHYEMDRRGADRRTPWHRRFQPQENNL